MKLAHLFFPLIIAASSCNSKQETTATSDSTVVEPAKAPADNLTSAEQVPTAEAGESSFPSYSLEYLSSDPQEASISEDLEALLSDYGSKKYLTIQGHRERQWEYEGEYSKINASEDETNTWYYDASYKLRAYSSEYSRNSDGDGRDSKTIIYLFSNDSLKAAYDNWDQDGQIGMRYQKRILASKCPSCGTTISKEAGSQSPNVNYLSTADLTKLNGEFLNLLSSTTHEITRAWENAKADGDHSNVDVKYAQQENTNSTISYYTVTYSVNNELYKNYISKQ